VTVIAQPPELTNLERLDLNRELSVELVKRRPRDADALMLALDTTPPEPGPEPRDPRG